MEKIYNPLENPTALLQVWFYLCNVDRFCCLSLLSGDITVDARWVEPGLGEGDEGTETGNIKQSHVEPRPASSKREK